jgi:hypothetical protein
MQRQAVDWASWDSLYLHGARTANTGSVILALSQECAGIPRGAPARRRVIDRLCQQADQDGQQLGDKNAATLQCEHVVKLMAARSAKPEAANALRKALRAMMQHAIDSARTIRPGM